MERHQEHLQYHMTTTHIFTVDHYWVPSGHLLTLAIAGAMNAQATALSVAVVAAMFAFCFCIDIYILII